MAYLLAYGLAVYERIPISDCADESLAAVVRGASKGESSDPWQDRGPSSTVAPEACPNRNTQASDALARFGSVTRARAPAQTKNGSVRSGRMVWEKRSLVYPICMGESPFIETE